MKQFLIKAFPFSFLLISISSIVPWCSLPIGNTSLWWALQSLILYQFLKFKPQGYEIFPIKLFLIYLLFSAIYGAIFMAENYWDWKLLVSNFMIFSLPLTSYVISRPSVLKLILKFWFKYSWIILIILTPFLSSDAYGRYLVPFTLLALFFPVIKKKYKIYSLTAYLITITLGSDSRSDTIKFTICLLLGLSLYIPIIWKNKKIILYSYCTILILPIILFILGVTNTFNIFKIEEELGLEGKFTIENEKGNQYSALTDTRTFLYIEVIQSVIKNDYLLLGRSIARGYDSMSFGETIDKAKGIKRGERGGCETSILNILNYFGIIGVVLYFIIFARASFLAIRKSRNIFLPVIGIYIAFRWSYAWIEDFSNFDLSYLFLWIFIGLCYSPIFRQMTNKEIVIWINQIITK